LTRETGEEQEGIFDISISLLDFDSTLAHHSLEAVRVPVKVASWPQIIIDIGHWIYMIGSQTDTRTPKTPFGTPQIFPTARATSTAVRALLNVLAWVG
jgi:hypothetical protein